MSGKNNEKYLTFLVLIDKQEHKDTIKWKIRFISTVRFMTNSLSSLNDNLQKIRQRQMQKLPVKRWVEDIQRWFTVWWRIISEIRKKYISSVTTTLTFSLSHVTQRWHEISLLDVITHKDGILQQLSNGEYHKYWLQTCQKILERLWIKISRPVSSSVSRK